MISKDAYWFKSDDPSDVVKQLDIYSDRWAEYTTNPVAEAWFRNLVSYYSCLLEPNDWQSSLGFVGEQGELVKMAVPQARTIIRQIVSIVTKERLAFKAIAEKQGSDVMNDVRLGNAVADKIIKEEHIDRKNELAVEHACVVGMGFMKATWRTDKGTPYSATAEGNLVYDGAVEISVPIIQDVSWDFRIQDWDQNYWIRIRTTKNRWDLIAQFPDLEEEIKQVPKILEDQTLRAPKSMLPSEEDLIYVYEAYHKPTPAMPKGRMIMYSTRDTIYFDGPNLYGCLPIIPIVPETIFGQGYGYPIFSNLLPCQEMFDHSLSAIASNHSNLAVQNVACPRNANVSVEQIKGMNFLMFTPQNAAGGGKPEPMNLLQSAPETFKFAEVLSKYMLDVSYLNAALRGQPPPGVTSGTAIATLTASSLEFLNGLGKANQLGLESLINLAVNIEMKFAKTPRSVSWNGKNNQAYVKEYTGDDLKNIKGFQMQRVNPLMQTLGGRVDAAEKLLQNGVCKTIQDYVSILEGAPLSQLTEVEVSENDLVQSENEALLNGSPVVVLVTDDHPFHIRKHKKLIDDPAVRLNNAMVKSVLVHIQEHVKQQQNGDPFLMAMANTGKAPQMPPGPPPGPPPQGGGENASPESAPLPGEPGNKVAEPAQDMLGGNR